MFLNSSRYFNGEVHFFNQPLMSLFYSGSMAGIESQNGFQNIWRFSRPKMDLLSKEEYLKIVQNQREEFVHKHFGETLETAFKGLRTEADKMRHCHYEVTFDIPDHFDVNQMEETLRSYFRGLHYEVIAEPRKEDTKSIVLTLT